MINLYFGLQFDNEPFLPFQELKRPFAIFGTRQLLEFLEATYGIVIEEADTEYIRLEMYRQAIDEIKQPNDFYFASFQADAFSTTLFLLQKREELKIEGYKFESDESTPSRIDCFNRIEKAYLRHQPPKSYGDRWAFLQEMTRQQPLQLFETVYLMEPENCFPVYLKNILQNTSINTEFQQIVKFKTASAQLGEAQKILQNLTYSKINASTSNILWVKAQDEECAAKWLAKFLHQQPNPDTVIYSEHESIILPLCLQSEGIPIPKTQVYDTARPSLQLLNLVLSFLWKPLEVNHLLDFFSLPIKPFDNRLGYLLAQTLADRPGFQLQRFEKVLQQRLSELEADSDTFNKCEKYFDFWFRRKHFQQSENIPTSTLKEIVLFLENWIAGLSLQQKQLTSLQSLNYQLDAIRELLELMPETGLSYVQLRNLIYRLNKPMVVNLNEDEKFAIPILKHPGQMAAPAERLIWFAFNESPKEQRFDFWNASEFAYFSSKNVHLPTVSTTKKLEQWYQLLPVLETHTFLILIELETLKGVEANPHSLNSFLKQVVSKDKHICSIFDEVNNSNFFDINNYISAVDKCLFKPKPAYFQLEESYSPSMRRIKESPSSMEKYLLFPHQWFFNYISKLSEGFQVQISEHNRLKGNIAHKIFQLYFENRSTIENKTNWLFQTFHYLLETEGSYFYQYGCETERHLFFKQIQKSLYVFEHQLDADDWKVLGYEQEISGILEEFLISGYADLILQKGNQKAIVDLKWSNEKKYVEMMRNYEDIQLAFYGTLLDSETIVPTAYYIMDTCQFIQKDKIPFSKAQVVNPKIDITDKHLALQSKLKATINWRKKQIESGFIEIRTLENEAVLSKLYENESLLDLLELKKADLYDKFEILILP